MHILTMAGAQDLKQGVLRYASLYKVYRASSSSISPVHLVRQTNSAVEGHIFCLVNGDIQGAVQPDGHAVACSRQLFQILLSSSIQRGFEVRLNGV